MSHKFPIENRIFIGNLDPKVSRKDVRKCFEKYGKLLEDIRMHKGFAFVQYDNHQSAQQAIAQENGRMMGSKAVEVQFANGGKKNKSKTLGKRAPESRAAEQHHHNDTKRANHGNQAGNTSWPNHSFSSVPSATQSTEATMAYRQQASYPIPLSIYVLNASSTNYATYVLETFRKFLPDVIRPQLVSVDEDSVVETVDSVSKRNDKYIVFVKKKNEADQTISFRAINPDGTSPGFADTPLNDVIQYISRQEKASSRPPVSLHPNNIYSASNASVGTGISNYNHLPQHQQHQQQQHSHVQHHQHLTSSLPLENSYAQIHGPNAGATATSNSLAYLDSSSSYDYSNSNGGTRNPLHTHHHVPPSSHEYNPLEPSKDYNLYDNSSGGGGGNATTDISSHHTSYLAPISTGPDSASSLSSLLSTLQSIIGPSDASTSSLDARSSNSRS